MTHDSQTTSSINVTSTTNVLNQTIPAVRIQNLSRRFDDLLAVNDLSLDIDEGEFFSVIGPSGCGKTTMLRMLAGLEQPSNGNILVRGADITFTPPHKRPVSTVFQQYALFPHLSVFENVAFGLRERKVDRSTVHANVSEMLELVGLSGKEGVKPAKLSGGQQQRVALARSLVLEPQVLLLDEPLGALDLKMRRRMQKLLKDIQRQVGITFVYVTHDQEEAFSMSDHVAVMNDGRIEQIGLPRQVYNHPSSTFVANFVGSANLFQGRIEESLSDGRYTVELGGIGSLVASGIAGMAASDKVTAIVRPEAMRPAAPSDSGAIVSGKITDVSYLGPYTSYTVDTGINGSITVTAHEEYSLEVDKFTWSPAATWLLPSAG